MSFLNLQNLPTLVSRIIKRARRNFVRRRWSAEAQLRRRVDGAIFAPAGKSVPSCAVPPGSRKRIYFRNVARGRYILGLQHRDAYLGDNRKSVILWFGFVTGTDYPAAPLDYGLQRGSSGGLFAYMGGGKPQRGRYMQKVALNVPAFQKWMYIDIEIAVDRFVNFEAIGLYAPLLDQIDFKKEIQSWVAKTPAIKSAMSLLYADIDLNVVDGSSVWLSSIASILCSFGPCVLVAKKEVLSDIVLSNVKNRESLVVLSPTDLGFPGLVFSVKQAAEILRDLDKILPDIRYAVVRGTDAAEELAATRQFSQRSVAYLTDFYQIGDNGFFVPENRKPQVATISSQAAYILTQTSAIADNLAEIAPFQFKSARLPPVIPDFLPQLESRVPDGVIKIGYAGKINPSWGIVELLDWVDQARAEGLMIELHIVANKISEVSGGNNSRGFRSEILSRIKTMNARHHQSLNRELSMELMASMDYVWCWRPATLEEHTLELSTKLVEMAAAGAKCICYPNEINRVTLGEDYPFLVKTYREFKDILSVETFPSEAISARIREEHSLSAITARLQAEVFQLHSPLRQQKICFAGHDMKFVHPYMSHLKLKGHEVVHDAWEWGEPIDLERTKQQQEWADIIFCEWGLSNAVWHSRNRRVGQKLFVRIHLQEIGARAKKTVAQIAAENVDLFIFVSERVRDEAVAIYGWPIEKTSVIPNYVLPGEYKFCRKQFTNEIRLGMVGVIPQRKRLDRAIDLLEELLRQGKSASLSIKGPRPETIGFMHGPSRKSELDYYYKQYARIEASSVLSGRVVFSDWGNNVAAWYQTVDHILSPSDFESFHYALADGVLSGCHPVAWQWEEVEKLYTSEWTVNDTVSAVTKIEAFRAKSESERNAELDANRSLVINRYGDQKVYSALNEVLGIDA